MAKPQNNGYRSRHWVATINNPDGTDVVPTSELEYCIVANEIGEQGTPHIQAYFIFKKQKTRGAVSKLLPRAYLATAKGTPQQAAEYCKKDGEFEEFGVLPESKYKKSGDATMNRWKRNLELARAGDVDSTDEDLQIRYYQNFKRIKQDHPPLVPDLDDVCGEWYYGLPRTGKSHAARERYPGIFDKCINKWWDGYQNEEYVLLDDFDMSHAKLGHHLKRWADRYSFPAEQKGTTTRIRPRKIIVTSNYLPSDIWTDDPVMKEAICERFVVEKFEKRYVKKDTK